LADPANPAKQFFMASMTGHDRAVGVIWSIGVIVLVASMIAGAIQVVSNFSSEMAFRWVMALFFLGGSLAWLTAYYQHALRRFFKR
jgi:hypothetical protein